jgi:hypothetical protein
VHTTQYGCELNFTVLVEEGATATAAELALYKKVEADTGSHLAYFVYILYRKLGGPYISPIPAQRYIPSSCKSWQVFDVSNITDYLPVGVHKFNLLVAVFKETSFGQVNPPIMSCKEAKSLFVMDTFADINKFHETDSEASGPEEPENETSEELNEVDENGKEKLNKDNNDNEIEDNKTELEKMMSSGSGGGEDLVAMTTSTPPIVEDLIKVEDYLPTLAVFMRGGPSPLQLTKRSAIQIKQNKTDTYEGEDTTTVEDSDESSGANCRLLENKIDLPALNPDIIRPPGITDIGKCSDSTERVECKPTAFRNLDTLQKSESGVSVFVVLKNFITTECTPCAKIQPTSPDDSTSSGSTIDDSQKEEDSDKMPLVTEPAGAGTEADLDEGGSGETTGANCTLLRNETQLSTISPYIIDPKSYDTGKCSESTDTVECRPTGFSDLTVTLLVNGTIYFHAFQNYIITECTPYLINTPNL